MTSNTSRLERTVGQWCSRSLKNPQSWSKLHLGCFDKILPGWLNTDITPHLFAARVPGLPFLLYRIGALSAERYAQHRKRIFRSVFYLNATSRFPFKEETFAYVFCSHFLEHLYPDDAEFCVREVFRVLKPGGIFRISVPDLDKLVSTYNVCAADAFCESVFEARQQADKNKHHWHYNERSLEGLLGRAGFRSIYRCAFREGRCADIDIIDNRPDSLFVEAEKVN